MSVKSVSGCCGSAPIRAPLRPSSSVVRDLSPAPPVSPPEWGPRQQSVRARRPSCHLPDHPGGRLQASEDLGSRLSPRAVCQLAPEGACKPASQSEPLLFAPPASPPITRRLQRSKSSHIIVSHCCRGEGCSPPPCAACQLAPEGVCVSAKSERRQNGKVPVRLSEAPHSRVAFVAIWTIIRPSHSSRSCGVYGCQVCVLGAIHHI